MTANLLYWSMGATAVAFFGGVILWVRHRVHVFDRRFGQHPQIGGE